MPDTVPIRSALISVSDKAGLVPFARALGGAGRADHLHRRFGANIARARAWR